MTRIAIIGGGIGGLTAALALRQAGFAPIVYERAPAFGEVGAGISLSPNSSKGMLHLGFAEMLEATASQPRDQYMLHGETGEELRHFDRSDSVERYGAPYYQLHRADLLGALADAFGPDDCRMAHELVDLTQDDAGVTLHFTDGSRAEADLVIGADGLRSPVREALFATGQPTFSGHVAWRALVPAERVDKRASGAININHIGPGKNLVTYPVRNGSLVNIVALSRSDEWAEESWFAKATPRELAAKFAGWTDYVTNMIAAIDEDDLYRWGLFVREPLETWTKGRVGLLGDAAHPMLPYMGQGASSAIEDAIVLGRAFAEADDPRAALALYEATRLERGAFLQRESNAGGDRMQALDPYQVRDAPYNGEDVLGVFAYDPVTVPLGTP